MKTEIFDKFEFIQYGQFFIDHPETQALFKRWRLGKS